jgi:hypothetical protein
MIAGMGLWSWVIDQYLDNDPNAGWLILAVINSMFIIIGVLVLLADYYFYFHPTGVDMLQTQAIYLTASWLWFAASSAYLLIYRWFHHVVYQNQTTQDDGQVGFLWITCMGITVSLFHLTTFMFFQQATFTSRLLELLAYLLLATNVGVYGFFIMLQSRYHTHFQYWHGGLVYWQLLLLIRVIGVILKLTVLWDRWWFVYQWDGHLPEKEYLTDLDHSWRWRLVCAHFILLSSDCLLSWRSWMMWRYRLGLGVKRYSF